MARKVEFASIEEYTHDFRFELQRSSKEALGGLNAVVQTDGYTWMEEYLQGILDNNASGSGSRLPVTELMKTPSRHTAKKTRTITTAAKDRTAKVNLANSKLLGSPTAKSTSSRPPLSPLGGRNFNTASAPVFQASPAKSPASKSSAAASKIDKGKGKAAVKKGRTKKNPEAENATPEDTSNSTRSATSGHPSARSEGMLGSNTAAPSRQASPMSAPPRPPRSPERALPPPVSAPSIPDIQAADEAVNVVMEDPPATTLEAEPVEEEAEELEEDNQDLTAAKAVPLPLSASSRPRTVDLSMIAEAEEDRTSVTIPTASEAQTVAAVLEPTPVVQAVEHVIPAPSQTEQTTEVPTVESEDRISQPALPTSSTGPDHAPSAINTSQTAPVAPARQVRSSWLNKALGAGTSTGSSAAGTAHRTSERTSIAGAPAVRLSTADYPIMRKSLVQPGTLAKRKSGEGAWDEEEEDREMEKRPGKIARVEAEHAPVGPGADAPVKPATATSSTPAVPAESAAKPSFDRHHSSETYPRSAPAQTDRQIPPRPAAPPTSNVDRVNKALDEMRERQQAKDAAKQKAALSLSIAAPASAPARSTGTGAGFLFGLGSSLGRSLGLGAAGPRDPEEDAKRAQQDKEEEEEVRRKAKEDLSLIMRKMEQPDVGEDEGAEEDEEMEDDTVPAPEAKEFHFQLGDEEEDELESDDEAEVNESIEIDEVTSLLGSPARPIAIPAATLQHPAVPNHPTSTPYRPLKDQLHSTTPQGTPPRSRIIAIVASPRQLRSSPAAVHPPVRAPRQLDGTIAASSTIHDRIKQFNGNAPSGAHQSSAGQSSKSPFLFSPSKSGARKSDAIEMDVEESPREAKSKPGAGRPVSPDTAEGEEEDGEDDEEMAERPASTMSRTASSASLATSLFGQASIMANKALGVKPAVGQVKSVQLAGSAYKKDLAASERRAQVKEQRIKNIADRKAEEEKKQKEREVEEKRLKQIELERRRKEAEERRVQISKAKAEKAEKERKERELQEKAEAEAEALRKHKLASSQNRPVPMQPAKRVISASSSSTNILLAKMKEPVKLTKPSAGGSSHGPSKLVPSTFRTAPAPPETPVNQMSHSGSIRLVGQPQPAHQQPAALAQAERKPLGPPTRPSAIRASNQAQAIRQSAAVASQHQQHTSSSAIASHTAVLAQSRLALQSQLEAEASEDIVLPDIASEYSDSGDETDDSPAFKRPQWAESPELRAALAAQASKNPDELFGPIRPLLMDELFKAQAKNKFRSRTSSGNWQRDGLKKEEEEEYARRMGFTTGAGKW